MIKPEQVPDEVIKAALLADERLGMREVIAAAINAWPGAIHNGHWLLFPHTKIPLPKKEPEA